MIMCDFIWGDFIEESVVDGLIDFWKNQDILYVKDGVVTFNKTTTVNKDLKDSRDITITTNLAVKSIQDYLTSLQCVLDKYKKKFPHCDATGQYNVDIGMNLQWYPVGGGYPLWHSERMSSSRSVVYRHLVFMTYLNDVPDGGTEWFHQKKYVPAQKGYTVIWPADWTHLHRGVISKTSEKYIITGWFSFM
tara:strand:- start:80 stop:652 length:573 start_codon:yes stop_codon:yes gene_type:complete